MRKEDYIGKKIIGFKFEHDECSFNKDMNKIIGVEGTIVGIIKKFNYFKVEFNGSQSSTWSFPIEFCLDRIVDYIPEFKAGVLMEVSNDVDFSHAKNRFVIGKAKEYYFAWNSAEKESEVDFKNVINWKYARPVKERVLQVTMEQIAEKFEVDKIEIV